MCPLFVIAIAGALLIVESCLWCHALNILVVGGSGRVDGSTVRWLRTLSERQQQHITISVGGRKHESYTDAIARNVLPSSLNVNFVQIDVDGDVSVLSETLRQWKEKAKHEDAPNNNLQYCLVVNTAGPFQGRRSPTLLSSCIDLHIPYVDVCDEWELALSSKVKYHTKAVDAGIPCIVSCGIWPGVSALMAAEGVSQLANKFAEATSATTTTSNLLEDVIKEDCGGGGGNNMEIESIDYSFFTAGTGNAGPTIVSATFLLLATQVLTYINGKRADIEPWTQIKDVDFGGTIGIRPVWLLDNPDVPSTALYLKSHNSNHEDMKIDNARVLNCSSRFGTAPLFWNYLFGAMKALPRSLLYNRNAMQNFALFSEPIIRFVDKLVGSTNAMRVDIIARSANGQREKITLRMAHPDLESCVGLATAAFVLEVASSIIGEDKTITASIEAGVWFPVELEKRARTNILKLVKEDAFVYELGETHI